MTWKIVSQEQLAALPSFQGLTLLGIHSVGYDHITYAWGSDERLPDERKQLMESEMNALTQHINGRLPVESVGATWP